MFFKLRNLRVSFLDGGESVLDFNFQLISVIFYAVGNSLVVLPDFLEVIDKVLGITDVTSTFFLKILDKDEDEGERAVNNVDGEVDEED